MQKEYTNRCEENDISLVEAALICLLKPKREHHQARITNEAK